MALTKKQKQKIIDKVKENLEKQKILLFIGIAGLKAEDMLNLRKKLKENNCLITVVKKTLLRIASQEKNMPIDVKKLESEIALIYGFEDEISAAKIINQFSLTNENLKILGGVFENEFIGREKVIELAKIPSREELLGRIVGSIQAPIANFANALQGNIRNLFYILNNIKS